MVLVCHLSGEVSSPWPLCYVAGIVTDLLSAFQVNVFDFALHDIKEDDVLIMATDGLWDVLCNDEVAHVVRSFLAENRTDPQR